MTPIIVSSIDGQPVAAGPAATIRAALHGAAPLTITGQNATGDTVWLAPRTKQVWRDDAVTVDTTDIARTIQHPEHGEIAYAWIDQTRLDQAPQLSALERARRQREATERAAQDERVAATVPACDNCDNCGDCELCV